LSSGSCPLGQNLSWFLEFSSRKAAVCHSCSWSGRLLSLYIRKTMGLVGWMHGRRHRTWEHEWNNTCQILAPNSIPSTRQPIPTKERKRVCVVSDFGIQTKQKQQHKKASCAIFVSPCPSYVFCIIISHTSKLLTMHDPNWKNVTLTFSRPQPLWIEHWP